MRNLVGMRNSYLISHLLIARSTQLILHVKLWTQNSSQMVALLVKPSKFLSPIFISSNSI